MYKLLSTIALSISLLIICASHQVEAITPTPLAQDNPIDTVIIHIHDNSLNGIDHGNIEIGQTNQLSVMAYNANRQPIYTGVSYEWNMSSTNSVANLVTNKTNDKLATLTGSQIGQGDIFVTARLGDHYKTGSVRINVIDYCEQAPACVYGQQTCDIAPPVNGWCPNNILPGDVDYSLQVNYADINAYKQHFNRVYYSTDFNRNKTTDIFDYATIVSRYGQLGPTPTPVISSPPTQDFLTDDQWNQLIDNPTVSWGSTDAPITIVAFLDYQCPFCKQHHLEVFPKLATEYVNDGKVRYIIRDYPLSFHQNASNAANVLYCVQDMPNMVGTLFARQDEWAPLANPLPNFQEMASDFQEDVNLFTDCYQRKAYSGLIDHNIQLANSVEVSGTPTFFVNKQRIVGALPFPYWERHIENILDQL